MTGFFEIYPNSKLFSVNVTEVLIHDYLILQKYKYIDDNDIQVITSENDSILPNKRLYLIPSSLKNFLYNKKIQIFINIASFQEMLMNEIDAYMDIIKNNKSLFYCCNRENKKLYDGNEIIFDKYPWGKGKLIFKENCPWHQKYYTLKPNFIYKYEGNIKHCLIDYSDGY